MYKNIQKKCTTLVLWKKMVSYYIYQVFIFAINNKMESIIKNTKQTQFNSIVGKIIELNDGESFGNITLEVGHDNPRFINIVCKKEQFSLIIENYFLDEVVIIHFFISSRFKHERWYTTASLLKIEKKS